MSIGPFNTTLIPVIKMMFKFGTILAIAQMVLFAVAMQPISADSTNSTEMATDSHGCFTKGELWKDLGTNESIIQAYDEQWCKNNVGWEPFGLKVKNPAGHLFVVQFSADEFTGQSLHTGSPNPTCFLLGVGDHRGP